MNEINFIVDKTPEGGYSASALGAGIFVQGANMDELKVNIHEAVESHFEGCECPEVVRILYRGEEII